jgi:hypothetical protein
MAMKKRKLMLVPAIILSLSVVYLVQLYYVTVNDTGGIHMPGYSGVPFVRNPTLEQRARRNPTFYPIIVRELPTGFITWQEIRDLAPDFSIHYWHFTFSVIGESHRTDLRAGQYSKEFVIFQNQLYIDMEAFYTILSELRELEQGSD